MFVLKINSFLIVILSLFFINIIQVDAASPYQFPKQIGNIESTELSEISGIASSYQYKNILWMLNDSGNSAYIYAVEFSGEIKAIYQLKNIRNIDWEDLASFTYQNQSYLIIADVGDNESVRPNRHLFFIKEPDLPSDPHEKMDLSVDFQIKYTYDDGPRDCESVAVDLPNQRILLLSKRDKPPRMYAIPLLPFKENRKVVANKIGTLDAIPKILSRDIRFNQHLQWGNQPTAMDISPVTHDLVIQTYKTAYLYPYQSDSDLSWNFNLTPITLVLPLLKQAESLCFGQDGHTIYVTSEKLPAPVIELKMKE